MHIVIIPLHSCRPRTFSMKAPLLLRIFLTPAALLLFLAGINGCRRQSEDLPSPVPAYPGTTSKHTYTSNFPRSENPISENGNWIVGSSAGASLTQGGRVQHLGRLWGDVQTSPGLAFGVDEPTKFGDPTAILTGAWGSDQTAIATVRIRKTPTGTCCHEVELRLRTTISPLSITGYEAYCSVMPSYPYCHIARWNRSP